MINSVPLLSPHKSPTKSPRQSTLNVLHNKLEYERQIQDQLLLEQQKEIEDLNSQIATLTQENDMLKHDLTSKIHELNLAQSKITDMNQFERTIEELQQSATNKIKSLEDQFSVTKNIQKKYDESMKKVSRQTIEIDSLNNTIKKLKHEISSLKDLDDGKVSQMDKLKLNHRNQIDSLTDEYDEKISELKKKLNLQTTNVGEYQSQISILKSQINQLKNKHASEVNELNQQMSKTSKKLSNKYSSEIHEINSTYHQNIDSLKSRQTEFVHTIDKLKENLNEKIQACKTMSDRYNKTIRTYESLKQKNSELLDAYNSSKAQVASLEQIIQLKNKEIQKLDLNLAETYETHKLQIYDLKQQMDTASSKTNQEQFQLQSEIYQLKEENKHLKQIEKELTTYKNKYTALQETYNTMEFQHNQQISKNRRLYEDLTNKDVIIRKLKKSIENISDTFQKSNLRNSKLTNKLSYFKQNNKKLHNVENQVNTLLNENTFLRTKLGNIVGQAAKMSCSAYRFCQVCNMNTIYLS